jgi:hypothetical protein
MKRAAKKLSVSATIVRSLRPLTDDDARHVEGASNRLTFCLGAGCGATAACAATITCR